MFKNNKIILHKKNGKSHIVHFIKGLSIRFKGKNSIVEIYEPISFNKRFIFNRSKIRISGDNNHIIIKSSNRKIYSLQIKGLKDNNKIIIGENFYQTGTCNIYFANLSNMELQIGNDCMFGQNTELMLGDYHRIYDANTNKQTNISKSGINIGNRVWLARQVKIMKDVALADDTIVSIGSLVTKSFTKSNILIGGTPAKILKENVYWKI